RFLERHEAALQAPAVSPGLRAEQLLALAAVTAWETRERLRSAQTGPSFTLGAGLHHGGLAGRQRRTITLPSGVWNTACTAWTEPEGSLRVAAQWDALSGTEGPNISAGRTGVLRERPPPHGQGRGGGHWGELELEGVVLPLWWFLMGERCWLNLRGFHVSAQVVDAAQGLRAGGVAEGRERLKAPLPGKVIQVCVKVGERVAEGQTVLVLEAMKMEHTLRAPFASIVKAVPFAEGAQVNREEVLVDLEPEGE
ncbi:MAG: hypothetical protein OEW39_14635, partial [Deltaproteobacteria bacterium]|nr:hypothetical protein [Deltaproteobacteria bacterium]